jgi:pimeloyl-ACP methyl ester carboxylesterase
LLLHAAGHTGAIWAPLVDELTTDRHVVAVDRRGYGDSEAARAPALQEAQDYGALLVRVGDESAGDQDGDDERETLTDVVAEGDGIDVALTLAALRPDLVGRLVLIGGARRTGGLMRWTGQQGAPSVAAPAPDRVLLVASAPKGAVPAQALMKSLVLRAKDPSTIRMVTLPGTAGDPLEAAPAAVTTIVAGFLREA